LKIFSSYEIKYSIIAEGIKDEATCKLLTEWGCESTQGYYFCKPLPVDELALWLSSSPTGKNNRQ
jgi:EAL domain-containing protein (putative c-di-GMP-specific phosphodiesterase class I)